VGGTLTGFHGHILIVDDPLDPRRSVSEVELLSANNWMDQTLSTRKIDKAVTVTVLIMQRLHQKDPTGHILERRKKVFHICIPGEIINYRNKVSPVELIDRYTDDGLLDPKRLNHEVLEDMEETLGQYGYAGQVGQDPSPPGGGMFKVDHFQSIERLPEQKYIEQVIRYWDKAATAEEEKIGKSASYTVGVKMLRYRRQDKTPGYVVADVKRGRWTSEERERIIKETAISDGKDCIVYVEQEPGSGGKDSAKATIRNLAGFSVHADRPTGDKVYRADPFSVQVNNGNVSLLRNPTWNSDYIEEHRSFPFGKDKDQVDASSGAFSHLVELKKVETLYKTKPYESTRRY
jgi:predicted phage terminase large subunit-like protein